MAEAEGEMAVVTPPEEAQIKAMPNSVSRKISAGQVILDPANIVKELLENSIDAIATSVEIRLREDGSNCIEVTDNGTGINSASLELLMKQHCTSKLSTFDDLQRVRTLGFRGEALASLATIATVTITTRTAASEMGERLVYEPGGALRERVPAMCEKGTTVLVEELFKSLPVRAQEFARHAKREMAKVQMLVQAYALYCPGVRIQLSNMGIGKPRQVLITSQPSATLRDSVAGLLGSSVARSLLEVTEELPQLELSFQALVSRPDPSSALQRSGSAHQFFYLNKRPIDFQRLARTISDLFRLTAGVSFGPILVICITASPSTFEINLTPDKRTVMFHEEELVMEQVHAAFSRLFQVHAATRQLPMLSPMSPTPLSSPPPRGLGRNSSTGSGGSSSSATSLARSVSSGLEGGAGSEFGSSSTSFLHNSGSGRAVSVTSFGAGSSAGFLKRKMDERAFSGVVSNEPKHCCDEEEERDTTEEDTFVTQRKHAAIALGGATKAVGEERADKPVSVPADTVVATNVHEPSTELPSMSATLDLDALASALLDGDTLEDLEDEPMLSRSRGTTYTTAENAEEQLDVMGRTFQRENFAVLDFLGQFNLAFLVARLHSHSLFIIDQHAADEKSNYEKFCNSLKVQTQLLLAPVPLELSPADLALAREELSALQACGFGVHDDGTHLLLTGFPISGSTELGIADFNELLALLVERRALSTPASVLPRPRRVTTMLMSRACRRAVMIGDPLEAEVCRRIIRGLATLRHPWQCPHGRPTINFLADLVNTPKCSYSRRPPS